MSRLILTVLFLSVSPVVSPALSQGTKDAKKRFDPTKQGGRRIVEEYTWKGTNRKRLVLRLDLGKGVTLDLVRIKKGTFKMGSPKNDKDADKDELPQHTVKIDRDFYIGKFEITRRQFARFIEITGHKTAAETNGMGACDYDPVTGGVPWRKNLRWSKAGFIQNQDHPVVNVSWNDALAFCNWLKKKTRRPIQLPTEAQWEYSCRGGAETIYFTGDNPKSLSEYANVRDARAKAKWGVGNIFLFDDGFAYTSPVGSYLPNGFGLYDMLGNVWEWCQSSWTENYTQTKTKESRVLRGGAWGDGAPSSSRCAFRGCMSPLRAINDLGFRVALTPADQGTKRR